MRTWLLFICILGVASVASARVFQMENEHFAAYLKGQYGVAGQTDEPFGPSGASTVTNDSSYSASTPNWGYEFGFIYSTKVINWRFGFEVLKPADLKNINATDANGTSLYTLTDSISGYAPKIGLELNLKRWKAARWFVAGDYGQATITVQNSYTFTSPGNTAFPGMTDFREEIQGTAPLIESSMGFEWLLADTTTLVLDAGYRSLNVTSFSHKQAVTTFQGAVSKGDAATNTDGSARTLNLSGAFASLWLRFWIQ